MSNYRDRRRAQRPSPMAKLLHRYKYAQDRSAGLLIAYHVARVLRHAQVDAEALLPVPLHRHRIRTRGYNQSVMLAQQAARAWGTPINYDCLLRTGLALPQVGTGRAARVRALRGAFTVTSAHRLPSTVALVDDVSTTGATLAAAATALVGAGVNEVRALVLLYTPPRAVHTGSDTKGWRHGAIGS